MNRINDILKKGIDEFSKSNYSIAEKIFLNLIRSNPLFFPAYTNLIQVFISQNKLDEAMKFAKKLFNLDKNSEKGLFFIGIIKFKSKQYSESLAYFKKALSINSNNYAVLMNIGITYFRLGDNLKAIQSIKESIVINNKNEMAYYISPFVILGVMLELLFYCKIRTKVYQYSQIE